MHFQKYSGFFQCFLAKSNLALFAPCGEPSVFVRMKSSLDCRLWQWMFFSWLDVAKGVFFTMERILLSSTAVVFRGHPGLFMLLSSPVHSFFSQNVPNCWFDYYECSCYLSDGFVLFLKPNNCLFHLYGDILWLHDACMHHSNSFQIQLAHLESTPDLLPA